MNAQGGCFAEFAGPMLLQSTVLMALLFGLDFALRKRVRATIRYAIWMLALIKLVLPPSIVSPTSVAYWLPDQPTESYAASAFAISPPPAASTIPHEIFTAQTTAPVSINWQAVVFVVWLAVAAGMGLWVAWRLRTVLRVIRHSSECPEPVQRLLESCRRQLNIKRTIIVRCAAIGSPAICGLFRPLILVPPSLAENLSEAEMRPVLLHELGHYKRGDLWVNHAQILLQIIYWYNPLLWLANAAIRRVREQAVDEMVLVEMGEQAQVYPATLLHIAKLGVGRPVAAIGFMGILEPGRGLKQRILHIVSRPFPRSARLGRCALGAIVLLAFVLLPMACHPKTDNTIPELVLKVADDGKITLDNENVTLEGLKQKLAEAFNRNHKIKLAIHAERMAPWSTMVKVFDAARDAHIDVASTVSMAASPSDWAGKQFRRPVLPSMLNSGDVDALEAKLEADPEDFSARRDLIAYYGFRDRGAKDKLVLWIIEHHPEFSASDPNMLINPAMEESSYKEGKALWLQHVKDQPTNTVILGNAAAYFFLADRALAEDLLKRAEVLEPRNPGWPERLGQLYKLEAQNNSATLAAKALAKFEEARALTVPTVPGSPGLADLGKMALVAGDLEKARTYAKELLGPGLEWSGGGNAGAALFQGNILLGRVALREGKIDEAQKYLLEAGKTKGSPVLDSFGPDMSLARELLEKHQTNAVLEYFQECEKFWPKYGNEDKLAE